MEFEETDERPPEGQSVAIYSKWAILLFSIFFSPFVGAILLMLNLRSVGRKREGTGILLLAIAYQLISRVILSIIFKDIPTAPRELLGNTRFFAYSIIPDIIGGGLLSEYFFKKYFPDDRHYEYKSIIGPLLIVLLLSIPLGLFYLSMNR
jgi:hypothetical protein